MKNITRREFMGKSAAAAADAAARVNSPNARRRFVPETMVKVRRSNASRPQAPASHADAAGWTHSVFRHTASHADAGDHSHPNVCSG